MVESEHDRPSGERRIGRDIGTKEQRKLRARREALSTVWSGLGMVGIVGWSVAVPTLLGAALGRYLDAHHPSPRSWTLALLVAGLVAGCALAWHWVAGEQREMYEGESSHDDDD